MQLEYHARKKHDDLPGICRNLLEVAKPPPNGWKCPTRRFGRTEVQMPIITVGGVRLQQTWAPDNLPITNTNISKDCQNNLVGAIKHALSMGINHFETARFYGTSELQVIPLRDPLRALCVPLCDVSVQRAMRVF